MPTPERNTKYIAKIHVKNPHICTEAEATTTCSVEKKL